MHSASMSDNLSADNKFIVTETLDKIGEKGEFLVWQFIEKLFRARECLGYWRYPIFSQTGKFRKEPDILIIDRELGLIIIEIKSIAIEQIENINGHRWEYKNFYTNYGNPYQQAENQLFTLLEYTKKEPSLHKKITGRVFISLPYITREEWQEKGFDRLPTNPPIIFADELQNFDLIEQKIKPTLPLVYGRAINPKQWQLLLSIIAGTTILCPAPHRVLSPPKSKGKILQELRKHYHQLDLQQERIAKQIPPGIQRIKGIAGSGKTVLLCQKAANMHLKHPDWDIAVVFFSRSLYDHILKQIDRWLRYFSNDRVTYQSSKRKLLVLHAWGSKKQPGLYSKICEALRASKLRVKDTESPKPNEALGEACYQLLKQYIIPPLFDAILIDEAQDLISNNWRFEGKQPFFWLAYQALKSRDLLHPEQRRLVYAYDEIQSTDNYNDLTARELFGEEMGYLLTGSYYNNINKNEFLSCCYRTPHQIVNLAFAMGMGLLRPIGMLTGMTDKKGWESIGYQVIGNFNLGEELILNRPIENSPNPIAQLWQERIIEFNTYYSRQEELSVLANNILKNLRQDGLRPSQEILVIIFGSTHDGIQLEDYAANFLIKQGIEVFVPCSSNQNLLNQNMSSRNPNKFWNEGAVTISRIHRAKGNEADMVYLIGLDNIAKAEDNISLRNQLFIGLTRARAWVNISGIGNYLMYEEMRKVIASGDTFKLTYRHQPKREIGASEKAEILTRYALGDRNFQNINLQRANLPGICLENANFIGANLRRANLRNAHLDGIKLIVADLENSDLTNASLKNAKLMGATLRNAKLINANLEGADLTNADLKDAQLVNTNLNHANLTGVDLTQANL